ncbi:sterol desaturase family protein [Aspergillus stella-maris]|uniref:sterol desaturase family protein n=1 Tax=Aspergillus stella-maris TaxID=1810926 RepID=UPI003CCD4780
MESFTQSVNEGWSHLYQTYTPRTIEFVGSAIVLFGAFWIPALALTTMDLLGPTVIGWRKIQAQSKQPNTAAMKKALSNCFSNQLLTGVIHLALLAATGKPLWKVGPTLPSLRDSVKQLFLASILQEIIFYHAHRALHHPYFYRKIHKKHHEFTTPIALAALYAHPIEYVASNILPVALPPYILGSHIVLFWFHLAWALVLAIVAHCGYELPSISKWNMVVHDMHHEFSRGNYGTIGLCDLIYGTRATEFKTSKVSKKQT